MGDLIHFTQNKNHAVHASTKENDIIRYMSLKENKYIRYFGGHDKRVVTTECLNAYFLGRAGRSVSFATENQRKIIRDIVKHARRPVKARVIPPKIIQKYFKRIAELEPDVT